YTHALVAALLGDPTSRNQGRQSLSVRAHLDPIGTLLCVVLAFLPVGAGPLGLGWGKPAKTDPWKLRGGPNVGTLLVAISGIVVSLVIGLLVAFLLQFFPVVFYTNSILYRIVQFAVVFAAANIALALFNILPVYPLDGYQIVYTLLPSRHALKFARTAQYGPVIIVVLLFVLPFVGSITRTDAFFLFRLPFYAMQGIIGLISMASGKSFDGLYYLYNKF
ncbi:MAG: site-2 protease family protein, partial [Ktedonobacteraceae bacterium]